MDPFLDASAFAALFRPLSAAESGVATLMLKVVSEWIREKKPTIDADDSAAKLVVFEVTREALVYGKYRPLSQFQDTTADRTKAGTFNAGEVEKFVTPRHYEMLGIGSSATASARGRFKPCDY